MNNLMDMSRKTTEIEKKGKKIIKKMKVYAVIIGIIGAITFSGFCFYSVSKWYDENKVIFQSPIIIKIQPPVVIQRREVARPKETRKIEPPVKQEKAYPNGFEEAYDKVWLMESGRGTNKTGLNGYCIEQGLINEIGYAPHDKYCFKDREEQKSTFITWLTNRINKVKNPWCESVDQCLRVYSNGSYGL